jgi:hypothetical protein
MMLALFHQLTKALVCLSPDLMLPTFEDLKNQNARAHFCALTEHFKLKNDPSPEVALSYCGRIFETFICQHLEHRDVP